jgi:AcrR family transcriptional regulator
MADAARPSEAASSNRRDVIVQEATRLFAERGYERATIAEIERAAGLSPGSGALYHHFATKADLLVAAIDAYTLRLGDVRHQLQAHRDRNPTDLPGDLTRIGTALAQFITEESNLAQAVGTDTRDLPEAARSALAAAWSQGDGIFVDLLTARGAPDLDREAVAIAMLGSLIQYFQQDVGGHPPLDVTFERYASAWGRVWIRAIQT